MGLGLQARTIDDMVKLMDLPVESLLGQLNRAVRRFLKALSSIQEAALAQKLPTAAATVADFTPVDIGLEQDLEQAAKVRSYKTCHPHINYQHYSKEAAWTYLRGLQNFYRV